MAFTIRLYNVTDEPNVVNKTLSSGWSNATCVFKDTEDYVNPHFLITGSNNQIQGRNYIKLENAGVFNRYYFITKIKSVTSGAASGNAVWDCECHEDVLMTYASAIKNLSGIVERQEQFTNLYLNDPEILKMSYPLIQHKAFPNSISTYNYFLTVAGGGV